MTIDLSKLTEPFPETDIEWRIGQSGTKTGGVWANALAYIQARAIMDRLDSVCGPENWKVDYHQVPAAEGVTPGVMCRIYIKIAGEWIYKEDGAEQTDFESFKGGISSALKRAGVVWGIGRYLYNLESAFVDTYEKSAPGLKYAKTKDGQVFYWRAPRLPDWALPKKDKITKPVEPNKGTETKPEPGRAAYEKVKDSIGNKSLEDLKARIWAFCKEKKMSQTDLAMAAADIFNGAQLSELSYEQYETLFAEIAS